MKKIMSIVTIIIILMGMSIILAGCNEKNNKTEEPVAENTESYESEELPEIVTDNYSDISDEEAYRIGNELYKKAADSYGSGVKVDKSKLIKDKYYRVENIDEIKSIYTENEFQNYISKNAQLEEIDGVFYQTNEEREKDITYLVTELKLDVVTNEDMVFVALDKYNTGSSEYDKSINELDSSNVEIRRRNFVLKKEDNNWKVEEYTLAN